ncbi:MAG: autotransporter-associated beta strand repeat-containing protein, partial [Anaerolineae bacterium]|nr:autotransporter-associated beta strand repeat-containing protein [Phycisphaerae bacterium]
MKPQHNKKSVRTMLLASAVTLASLGSASIGVAGVIYQWSGAAGAGSATSWGIANNWAGAALPVANSEVTFGGAFQSGLSISIAGTVPMSRFTIDTDKSFSLNADAAAGANTLTLSQGRMDRINTSSGTQTIAANVAQQAAGAWDIRGGGAMVVSGVVSGSSITKMGNGTLILSGANTHARTIVNEGTVQISATANLGAATGTLALSNAALAVFGSVTVDQPIQLAGTGTVSIPSGTVYLQGGIHGNGNLVKAGPGRMRLFGNGINTYTGNVTNLEGQLLTNSSSLRGNVTNYGELQLSQTSTGTYTSNISGPVYVLIGGGNITFTGNNSFTGGMTINDTIV